MAADYVGYRTRSVGMRRWTFSVLGFLTMSTPAAAQTPYDGTWNVTIQTKAGSCDPTASHDVTVSDGKVSGPANVSGTVGRSGNVRVSIGAAYANGQLDGKAGSGKWNGASGGVPCSGRWEASKQ
jgi:type 1 fimbria pilin